MGQRSSLSLGATPMDNTSHDEYNTLCEHYAAALFKTAMFSLQVCTPSKTLAMPPLELMQLAMSFALYPTSTDTNIPANTANDAAT